MFERFTDRARAALVLAQQEAVDQGHGFIGTEHLLLGLLREGEGVAAVVLHEHGITLDAMRERVIAELGVIDPAAALATIGIDLQEVRRSVEASFGEGALRVPAAQPPFTPKAKRVLELALHAAVGLNHWYIGSEHLLLGLLDETEGLATQLLVEAGCDLPAVRSSVLELVAPEASRVRELEDRLLRLAFAPRNLDPAAVAARHAWSAARQRHADAVRPLMSQLADELDAVLREAEAALASDTATGA